MHRLSLLFPVSGLLTLNVSKTRALAYLQGSLMTEPVIDFPMEFS